MFDSRGSRDRASVIGYKVHVGSVIGYMANRC